MEREPTNKPAGPGQEKRPPYVLPFKRERTVSRSVVIADRIADWTITIGGIAVIVTAMGIMAFLVGEVLPLFKGAAVTGRHEYGFPSPEVTTLGLAMDEYKTVVLRVLGDGSIALFHAKTGFRLEPPRFEPYGRDVTAFASTPDRKHLVFGFEDGRIRFASLRFVSEVLPVDAMPGGLYRLDDRDRTDGKAVYSTIPGKQVRKISVELKIGEVLRVSKSGKPIVAVDYRVSGEAERKTRAVVAIERDGVPVLVLAKSKVNLLTGEERTEIQRTDLPRLPAGTSVAAVLLAEKADAVYVAAQSGILYRYDAGRTDNPFLAETRRVLPQGVRLTACSFLAGNGSIVVGGSDGSLGIWFLVGREGAPTRDGRTLVRARELPPGAGAIVDLDAARRGRAFAARDAAGTLRVLHATSRKTLFRSAVGSGESRSRGLLLSARIDAVLALEENGKARFWDFSAPHPETTVRTLFGRVWYEGYPEASYTWQSSAATDDFEPKFSLVPLIFGTLKATVYSLMFALPIAILGAVYTSEFLPERVRVFIKPTMEMMATLPSVVLGFVAALVLAPLVESWIASVILAFVALPISLMAGAYLWQMLPLHVATRLQGIPKFTFLFVATGFGLYLAYHLGPLFERVFFRGDFKAWLVGGRGGPEPFLFLLALPAAFAMVAAASSRITGRRLARYMRRINRLRAALLDMARWLILTGFAVLCSYGIALLLGRLGVDARGSLVGTYVQRNTLVVGFAMGFAVIPIIYTLAEDALNSVPHHLRAASLACGATTWQTAVWVVLPTAASGVFSAVMIGMGRAVGETMIVVMAAGNTPVMDWNIFSGLRALSATIAVELPEAVRGGTLYRVLFLAGLVLLAMTFVINTVAEIVRQRFRKRSVQL